jgi:hypothetical protein
MSIFMPQFKHNEEKNIQTKDDWFISPFYFEKKEFMFFFTFSSVALILLGGF